MREIFVGAFTQLLTTSPVLLVYVIGAVMAIVNLQRYPGAARLTLAGCVLLFVIAVAQAFAFQYVIFERAQLGWTAANVGVVFTVLGVITSLMHAAGLGLLLAAAFAGRRTASV